MKSTLRELSTPELPPVPGYYSEDSNIWLYNVKFLQTKQGRSYATGDIYLKGLVIPRTRLISGYILPPQVKLGGTYTSLVKCTQKLAREIYNLWLEVLLDPSSPKLELKPFDQVMNAWALETEDFY